MSNDLVSKYNQLLTDIIDEQLPLQLIQYFTNNPNHLVKVDNITTQLDNHVLSIVEKENKIDKLLDDPYISNISINHDTLELICMCYSKLKNMEIASCSLISDDINLTVPVTNNIAVFSIPLSIENITIFSTDMCNNVSSHIDYSLTSEFVSSYTERMLQVDNTPSSIENIRKLAVDKIDEYVNKLINSGFIFPTTIDNESVLLHIEYTPFEQNNLTDNLIMSIIDNNLLNNSNTTTISGYKDYTSSFKGTLVSIQCDANQLLKLFSTAMMHKQSCMIKGQVLKTEISKISDIEKIFDILSTL